MRKLGPLLFGFGIAVLSLAAAPANAQTNTVFVAGAGSDTNPCTFAQPCRQLFEATNLVASGGTVVCLDVGPYFYEGGNPFTIIKSVTYDCPGIYQFIGSGVINISASNIVVRFRKLTFDGTGGPPGGIIVGVGNPTVICENCKFQNFTHGAAIAVEFKPSSPAAQLILTDTVFSNNGIAPSTGGGLLVFPFSGGSAGVVLNRVTFEFNVTAMVLNSGSGTIAVNMKESLVTSSRSNGILSQAGSTINFIIDRSSLTNNVGNALQSSGANSHLFLNDSTIFGNQIGVSAVSGGIVQSYKNNRINGNGTNGTPLAAVPGVTGNLQ